MVWLRYKNFDCVHARLNQHSQLLAVFFVELSGNVSCDEALAVRKHDRVNDDLIDEQPAKEQVESDDCHNNPQVPLCIVNQQPLTDSNEAKNQCEQEPDRYKTDTLTKF
jgi:hypothetical protein